MTTSAPNADERVRDVHVDAEALTLALMDGRTIAVPLALDRAATNGGLLDAAPAQRANGEVVDASYGIHWLDLDEDLSTEGPLRGAPAACKTTEAV